MKRKLLCVYLIAMLSLGFAIPASADLLWEPFDDAYYQKNKKLIPLMGKLTKPKSYDRFLIQAEACRKHDSYDLLGSVTAPTLVMGGEQDKCLGGEASRELAARISGAQPKMYPQWGHGLYEEAGDFLKVIREFLENETEDG